MGFTMSKLVIFISIVSVQLLVQYVNCNYLEMNITVPPLNVTKKDSYVCIAKKLPPSPHKLVGVRPLAHMDVVHHILLFGCGQPFKLPANNETSVWDCMENPVCGSSYSGIMYGWGRNAPSLTLPEGVGFTVGGESGIRWVVAQVHFLNADHSGKNAGVTLGLKPHAVPNEAGLITYASNFAIPPGLAKYEVNNECCYNGHQPLTTFAYRVHTHTLGRRVYMERSSYRTIAYKNFSRVVPYPKELMADRDPLLAQAFVPAKNFTVHHGDRLKVTCDFDSTGQTTVVVAGATHEHEMCNLYLMVYAPLPHLQMCSNGMTFGGYDNPGTLPMAGKFVLEPTFGAQSWHAIPYQEPKNNPTAKGRITSVTSGPDGTIWALYRGDHVWDAAAFSGDMKALKTTFKTPISALVVVQLEADTGRVLQHWGGGVFYMPHMITVDRWGYVWVVDTGLHQVLKFSPTGERHLAVGVPLTPGQKGPQMCQPTDVTVLNDGSFLVGNGYCSQQVLHFDSIGKMMGSMSSTKFQIVHSVLVDECVGVVYAASRLNGLVLAFGLKSRQEQNQYDLSKYGEVWALTRGPYGMVMALTWSNGKPAHLVNVEHPEASYEIPGLENAFPHDLTLGAASLHLSGAGDRLFALWVAPLCANCTLMKYVLLPHNSSKLVSQPLEHTASLAPAHGGFVHAPMHGGATQRAGPAKAMVANVTGALIAVHEGEDDYDNSTDYSTGEVDLGEEDGEPSRLESWAELVTNGPLPIGSALLGVVVACLVLGALLGMSAYVILKSIIKPKTLPKQSSIDDMLQDIVDLQAKHPVVKSAD